MIENDSTGMLRVNTDCKQSNSISMVEPTTSSIRKKVNNKSLFRKCLHFLEESLNLKSQNETEEGVSSIQLNCKRQIYLYFIVCLTLFGITLGLNLLQSIYNN